MSRRCFDHLQESVLFRQSSIDQDYADLDAKELRRALRAYRHYVETNLRDLEADAVPPDGGRAVHIEGRRRALPTVELVKRSALYIDSLLVDDPLIRFTSSKPKDQDVVERAVGVRSTPVVRADIATAARFMKSLTSGVAGNLVHFLPVSFLHEAPRETPFTYSPTAWADALPAPIMQWLRERATVNPLRRKGESWTLYPQDPLVPCRAIAVHWNREPGTIHFFNLFETKVLDVDADTGAFKMVQVFPDTPPDAEQFDAWVDQSINQASLRLVEALARELSVSVRTRSHFMTQSPFIMSLLTTAFDGRHDPAGHVFEMDLPAVEDATLDDIMRVRTNDGEAFACFRRFLSRHVERWSQIEDPDELRRVMREAEVELSETALADVKATLARSRKILAGQGVAALTSALAIGVQPGRTSLAAAVLGVGAFLGSAYASFQEYRQAAVHPAAFLLKVAKTSR